MPNLKKIKKTENMVSYEFFLRNMQFNVFHMT